MIESSKLIKTSVLVAFFLIGQNSCMIINSQQMQEAKPFHPPHVKKTAKEVVQDMLDKAVDKRDMRSLKKLVHNGADINYKVEKGRSVLSRAVRIPSNFRMVEFLLQSGAKVNVVACAGDKPPDVYLLTLEEYYRYECTILMRAIVCRVRESTIKQLIRHGANVNLCNKFGLGPLHVAVIEGRFEIVRYLLQSGADVNAPIRICVDVRRFFGDRSKTPHFSRETPLDLAYKCSSARMVNLLKEYGGKPSGSRFTREPYFYR